MTDKFRYTNQNFKLLEEIIIDDVINSKHLYLHLLQIYFALNCRALAKRLPPNKGKFTGKT